ncbi:MAG: hypothetical protein ACREQI_02050 [Candidatus Binataceae bacterium]
MSQEYADTVRVADAVKAIAETPKGLDKTHQERAMRFASESLGLGLPAQVSTPSMAGQLATPAPAPFLGDPRHATDIRQFTAEKAPKSDQQFAAVAAYFYQFMARESERKDWVTKEQLREAARLAKYRQPRNLLQTLVNAKNAGYLENAGPGRYRISTVGENLVAITLPGGEGTNAGNHQNGRRRPAKKARRKGIVKSAA